ncbi:LPA3 [Scenedesmus sp. PABB004]|nr:LPA3 [Scenedesmus sp. PABB004]
MRLACGAPAGARRAADPAARGRAFAPAPARPGGHGAAARRAARAAAAAAGAAEGGAPAAPPARGAGRMTYRPASYSELVQDASRAVLAAIADGVALMEVEFPAVPTNIDAYKGSSDLFIDSNIQYALLAGKLIAATGKKVHIVAPDLGEYARSFKMFKSTLDLMPGVSLGHLKEAKPADLLSGLQSLFAGGAPDPAAAGAAADVFIVANVTGVELPALEEYTLTVAAGKPVVTWNLELDTLRGDLGLLGYPPKDVHYRFLSRVRAAFFLRARDYSKSVAAAPFIINYSGALFREYPGPWQVLLKQDSGDYACIAEDAVRYNLGDVKEELMAAMGLNTEEAGSTMAFLRRGYKTSTWFEDDAELEQHKDWRL